MSRIERPAAIGRRRVLKGALAVPVASAAMLALSEEPAAAHARDADMFDIRTYGASANNPAANTQAITAALAAIATNGGGVLYVPPGVWKLNAGIPLSTPGTTLLGTGIKASTLALATGVNDTVVKVNVNNVSVERLTVQGHPPYPNSGGNHGIRFGSSVQWGRVRDVIVSSTFGYGIGLEGGSYSYIEIDSVSISDCGHDGIDWKNDDTTNADHTVADAHPELSGTRNIVRNVIVRDFAGAEAAQAGVDVRGRVGLQNIEVFVPALGLFGVRFRQTSVEHGIGGDWSTLENYYVEVPDNSGAIDRGVKRESLAIHAVWDTGNVHGVTP